MAAALMVVTEMLTGADERDAGSRMGHEVRFKGRHRTQTPRSGGAFMCGDIPTENSEIGGERPGRLAYEQVTEGYLLGVGERSNCCAEVAP